uniref:Uncharacterized protein n=1 Tax=Zea mays TaxID=4577 RepID=A0A804LRB0_MAIZE
MSGWEKVLQAAPELIFFFIPVAPLLSIFLSSSRVDICCGHSSPVAAAQLQKYPAAVRWYLSPQLARSRPSPADAPIPWPKPPGPRSGRPAQFFFQYRASCFPFQPTEAPSSSHGASGSLSHGSLSDRPRSLHGRELSPCYALAAEFLCASSLPAGALKFLCSPELSLPCGYNSCARPSFSARRSSPSPSARRALSAPHGRASCVCCRIPTPAP